MNKDVAEFTQYSRRQVIHCNDNCKTSQTELMGQMIGIFWIQIAWHSPSQWAVVLNKPSFM